MIAHTLGDKVVIMSTSTGSPLALKLAADYPDKVSGLVNLSPNLRIRAAAARILNDPWGKQIAELIYGKGRVIHHKQDEAVKYWDTLHTPSSLVALEELLETTMHDSLFARVNCPVLTLYYYKDDKHQDEVVDVSVIPAMHQALGTPLAKKKYIPLATPGDHVIGSSIKSMDYEIVEQQVKTFCRDVIGMPVAPVPGTSNL
ncbi:MAG: alpha/beta hydrolase, partial [Owenweeksia sp.]